MALEQQTSNSYDWCPIYRRSVHGFISEYFKQVCCRFIIRTQKKKQVEEKSASTSQTSKDNISDSTASTSRTIASTSHPIASTSHPIASTSHPISSISHPIASTSHPIASTSQEVEYYDESFDSSDFNSESELHFENVPLNKKRKFNLNPNIQSLAKEFPFIDDSKDFLFCKLCNQKVSGTSFHLKRHAVTSAHKKNELAAKKTPQIDTMFLKGSVQHNNFFLIREAELRLCCYICEHNLPMLIFDSLPLFNSSIYPDSEVAKGITLKRTKANKLIVRVLGPFFKEETLTDIRENYFSIIIDETTDIGTKKSMVIIVRYFKEGKVTDRLLDLIEVQSATGESLFEMIKSILDKNAVPYEKIIGFAADNASAMMGIWNSVQVRFKRIVPHIYIQGCTCHSLHLCSSAAAKKLPKSVEQFARDVYSYFSHSSKRIEELRECQIFANEKPHKMLYPSQTRWLSLKAVVERLLEHWNSLMLFFQKEALEDNLPSAKNILNALNNQEYKIYLLFLSYVLELIIKINIELQSESPKLPIFLNRISGLYKTILRCFIKKEIIGKINMEYINVNNPSNYIPLEDVYVGAKLDALIKSDNFKVALPALNNFRKRAVEFYVELCNQVKQRFRFDDPHLKFASNFTPEVALSGDVRSIAEFMNLFPNVAVDIESANAEWQLLPEISIPGCEKKTADINVFWASVSKMRNSLEEPMFANIMVILKVILSLPHSSATAERVFSQLNITKTFLRNRLLVETCAAILQVKDKMRRLPGGAIKWRPDRKLLTYNYSMLDEVEDSL